MAINRNAYMSLIESVQEAVAPQDLVEWPLNIGGQVANNATELAQILNSMMYSGKSSGASVGTASGTAGKYNRNAMASTRVSSKASRGSRPSKPVFASKTPGTSVGAASIAEDNLVEWPLNIGGQVANNATELAQILNGMQNSGKPSGASVGTASGTAGKYNRNAMASTRRSSKPSKPGTKTPGTTGTKTPGTSIGAAALAEDGDWDILDEILAEGLELYGEDGLAEILADFAETGDMSQELSDLLDGSDQLDEVSLKTKIRAYKERATREFESDGDDARDFTKGGVSKADRTRANIVKYHGKAAGKHADRAAHSGIFGRSRMPRT